MLTPPRLSRSRLGGPLRLSLVAFATLLVVSACTASTGLGPVGPVKRPPAPEFGTPDASVRTYIAYTAFAYRMANSSLASQAATPYEGVRIDSYIELNRQKGQGIEQRLVRFRKRAESKEGTRVALAASEEWTYRYFSLTTLQYLSEPLSASYEATYTLVRDPKGWLVDKVDATALSPVK